MSQKVVVVAPSPKVVVSKPIPPPKPAGLSYSGVRFRKPPPPSFPSIAAASTDKSSPPSSSCDKQFTCKGQVFL